MTTIATSPAHEIVPSSDRPFAILRYKKLKTVGEIRAAETRLRPAAPSSDACAAFASSNVILVGTDHQAADVLALVPALGARGPDGKLLRRSNSVLAIEVEMSVGWEWWRDASQEDLDLWIETSFAWLRSEWEESNIASLRTRSDGSTPHLLGLIVPLDPKTGRLNARRWIGGEASRSRPGESLLSQHQTSYAAAVASLGLHRGRIGSPRPR